MTSTTRSFVRRLAPFVAALQLAAVACVPVVESLYERSPVTASVEAAHEHCTLVHDAATCAACALATARARPAERPTLAVRGPAAGALEPEPRAAGPLRRAPGAMRSRAPPALA